MDRFRDSGVATVVRNIAVTIGLVALCVVIVAHGWRRDERTGAVCDAFAFPVGPPDATGYYDAQPFGVNDHLGNDWNGNGGNDTDLGDPVYAASSGVVVEATDHAGGWGNVIRIVHDCAGQRIESLYAHLDAIEIASGLWVARGQRIGTIGTAGGQYRAHLHFELRDRALPLGGGYARDRTGYLDPTAFIRSHREITVR